MEIDKTNTHYMGMRFVVFVAIAADNIIAQTEIYFCPFN